MILNFFINGCILITFISLAFVVFKERAEYFPSSLVSKTVIGFCGGLLGIVLMMTSVNTMPNIMIDFRYLPMLITAVYMGFLPTMIAAFLIGIFRLFYFGVTNSSVAGFIVAILVGIGFGLICKYIRTNRKWVYSLLYLFFVFSIALFILSGTTVLYFKTIAIYYIGNICVIYIVYLYSEYMSELMQAHHRLKNESTKDYLTGLNNLRQYDVSFCEVSQLAIRKEESLSLLYLDIDHFKNVNDSYGHSAGDIVLQVTAGILKETVRIFDVVSRNGGEEFSIILLDCAAEHAMKIAERIRKKVEEQDFFISKEEKSHITISIGAASYPATVTNVEELLGNADKALYRAKQSGRNRVVLFEE